MTIKGFENAAGDMVYYRSGHEEDVESGGRVEENHERLGRILTRS